MTSFFAKSHSLDHDVLRPLSHILGNWETTWDATNQKYFEEEDSYATQLNALIDELGAITPPSKYHDNEDCLAQYVITHLKWPIHKEGNRWAGEDYDVILQQGGFHDFNEQELVLAAAGRIRAAIDRGQSHYDEMEESHRRMLAAVLTAILYHRTPPLEDDKD